MPLKRCLASTILWCMVLVLGTSTELFGQPAKTVKEEILGSWKLVSIINTRVDGSKYELFGEKAKGTIHFDSSGSYSLQIMREARPAFVAGSRVEGTAEENRAAVHGMISHFGSYEVDEAGRKIIFRIQGSSYPNWEKAEQTREFVLLGSRLTWSDPSVGPRSGDLQSDLIWSR